MYRQLTALILPLGEMAKMNNENLEHLMRVHFPGLDLDYINDMTKYSLH